MRPFPAPGAMALLACVLHAQTYTTGWRDLTLTNPTTQGSPVIPVRVHYPSPSFGPDAPILAKAGGWPVVVFLHGSGSMGSDYTTVSIPLAEHGFVAVMIDDARYDMVVLAADAIAMFGMLQAETVDTASPLFGALDMDHAGLEGYSMGGGAVLRALSSNPGYLSGFCHAPAYYVSSVANITVPVAIVHGQGDTVVPVGSSLTYLRDMISFTGSKTLYLFNTDGDHNNVVSTYLARPQDLAIVARMQKVLIGFQTACLLGDPSGLEQVVGTAAAAEPRLASITHSVADPALWIASTGKIGDPLRITQNGEVGPGFTMLALGRAIQNTPFGTFELDPASTVILATPMFDASRVVVLDLVIPPLPGLVGKVFSFQGSALTVGPSGRLSGATDLPILP